MNDNPVMAGNRRTPRNEILGVVGAYAALAALWILFSDMAVESMFSDTAQLTRASMLKGWLFVAVTSLFLYALLRRLVSRVQHSQADRLRALSLLSDIADGADDAIFAKDREGRYLLFNRGAAEIVGKPAWQVLGQDDHAIFPAEQAAQLMAIDRRIIANVATEINEEALDTAQGSRVFHTTKGPLRDADGRVVGTFGISRDITERKRVEQALCDREHSLSAIINNSPAMLSLKHPDGRYALANPNLQRVLGLSEAQIVGRTDFDFYPDETARILRDNDERMLRTRTRHSIEEIVPTDEQPRVYMSHMFPVLADDGTVAYICRISLDITERKRAEESLRQLADDLAATLQAVPDLLFELDETGRYIAVKATQESLLAAPTEQLIGHTVHDVMPPDAAQAVMASLAAARRTGADFGRTITLELGGITHWFELSVACKPGKPGELQRFVVLSRDVSARKADEEALRRQTEELTRRNAELERFNRATVGRELDMIELKRQINALSRELGREAPFALPRLEIPDASSRAFAK